MRQVSRAGLTFRERLLGHVDTSMHSGSEISAAWIVVGPPSRSDGEARRRCAQSPLPSDDKRRYP
jgi:hypothetical protein